MKRRLGVIVVLIALIFGQSGYVSALSEPELEASAAIIYCENTDEIIFKKDIDTPYDPYSITKVLTAYIVSQNISDFSKTVIISEEAAAIGGSTMDLTAGEELTIEQLMYGMMLPSGNDASYALAETVAGDEDAFVDIMNEIAEKHGCQNTHFQNSYGWQSSEHYTSARDYLVLTRLALSDPRVYEIVTSKKYYVPETEYHEERILRNHVPLINVADSGVIGGKTGFWSDYDCSAIIRYEKKGLGLTMVLLNDTTDERRKDISKMLSYAEQRVVGFEAVVQGDEGETVRIRHSANINAKTEAAKTAYAYPASGDENDIITKTVFKKDLEAPMNAGDEVGLIEVYANDKLAATVPIVLKEDVRVGWFPSYWYISNAMTLVIALALFLLIVLVLMLWMKKRNRQRRLRRQRMERLERLEQMERTERKR